MAAGAWESDLLPVRLGEVVRPWLLSRRTQITFSNVVGNVVLEKTLDSVVILFYILVGLLTVSNLPLWVRRGAMVPAAAAVILVILVGVPLGVLSAVRRNAPVDHAARTLSMVSPACRISNRIARNIPAAPSTAPTATPTGLHPT